MATKKVKDTAFIAAVNEAKAQRTQPPADIIEEKEEEEVHELTVTEEEIKITNPEN